jgi:two-component system, NtrC family, response regulator AtoC
VLAKNERIILLGGCEHEMRVRLEPTLRSLGFSLEIAQDTKAVKAFLETSEREIAAVFIDAAMPGQEGFETVGTIRSRHSCLPIIVVAGKPSTEDVVTAMRSGASDFLSAPIMHEDIVAVLTRAMETGSDERAYAQANTDDKGFFAGENPRMREIQGLVGQIGQSNAPVLIQGETGSGKEVLARELHRRSPRAHRPFLKLNCAALPSELVESELFGYERGAFTGAFKRKEGMFELADGGTLLLDEIGDMDVRLQAKLLQVLQDREFRRIGGKEIVRVDVRIIAASHRDLEKGIQDRVFREDLYYRLNVVNLVVPPLRERKEDIIPIAEFLIKKHAGNDAVAPEISLELKQAMIGYSWPGNVRELENYARNLMIFQDCSLIARELRARTMRKQPVSAQSVDSPPPATQSANGFSALEEATRIKERAEIDVIVAALNSTHWNRKQAAAILNIDYKSLLYKMKKLAIDNSPISMPERTEAPLSRARAAGD